MLFSVLSRLHLQGHGMFCAPLVVAQGLTLRFSSLGVVPDIRLRARLVFSTSSLNPSQHGNKDRTSSRAWTRVRTCAKDVSSLSSLKKKVLYSLYLCQIRRTSQIRTPDKDLNLMLEIRTSPRG
jgi:hypothetical protein